MKSLRGVACDAVTDARRYGAQEAAAGSYRARHVEMTGKEREEQRRSFAFGNTKIENDLITREMIDKQADAQKKRANG